MSKPLIIYFNDEKMVKSATDHSKFLKKMKFLAKGNSLPVSSVEDFETLINILPNDLDVFVFIHIMGDALVENISADNNVEFQGKTWAISLRQQYPNCNFLFVTSNLTQTSVEIYDGIPAHNITDLMDKIFVKKSPDYKPQKVYEIKSLEVMSPNEPVVELTSNNSDEETDFAIITALVKDEYTSFSSNMEGNSLKGVFYGKFKGLKDKEYSSKKIALLSQKKMGMVDSSLTTSFVYKTINPKMVILAGVCGGRKDKKVKLYDIIIPENIVDIVTGKFEKSEFIPYGFTEPINEDLIAHLKKVTENPDFVAEEMHRLIPNGAKFKRENEIVKKIQIHYDVLACGPFVLKTEKFLEEKAKQLNDKIVGFEMESYGLMRATKLLGNPSKMSLVVKSVMDYTDSKKGDIKQIAETDSNDADIDNVPPGENIKEMAAYMSSICTRALLPHIELFLKENRF